MRHRLAIFSLLLSLSLVPLSARATASLLSEQEICPGRLVLRNSPKIKFTEIEKSFLCGDPQIDAWKYIPPAQVKFQLETFLQDRGYFQPRFTEEGDELVAELGEALHVTRIEAVGAPPSLDLRKRRGVVGRLLNPRLLDREEKWVEAQLKAQGYACPVVKSRANVLTGEVKIDIDPGRKQNVTSIDVEPVRRMNSEVLRRFDAFEVGKPFNNDFLTLTSKRVEKDGILQSTHFIPECREDGVALTQKTIAGKPRLISVGFGGDTEQYAIVKTSWRHTRLGRNASLFDISLFGSYKRQELDISNSWYLSPTARWHLMPVLTFSHDREAQYHFVSANAKFAFANSWDNQNLGLQYSFGPNLNYVDTFRGAQPGVTRLLSLQYDFHLASHYFEFYSNSPRTGFRLGLVGDFTNKNLLSEITAERFRLDGEYLYNFRGYDPPLLIFGVRGGFGGTFLKKDPQSLAALPPNYRFYLGGSTDLRGFGRQELSGPGLDGALSMAFTSFEIRLANVLPLWMQPIAFMDVGILGNQAFSFQLPVYYSPGFGVRCESPIGVFRATLARGFKSGGNDGVTDNTHLQFFISFGEEF
ncbi:MAG: BamA/TamA family outer membrane protein [bacterium]